MQGKTTRQGRILKKVIYIAGPYTMGDVAQNVRNAVFAGDKLWDMGYVSIIPHLFHFWHYISPKGWQEWMDMDIVLLGKCDGLLRLDGESKGADIEVTLAKDLNIPVYYDIKDISG